MLIGVGCAPAFLVCTVFIARHFPASRFAAVSGTVMGLSSIGMLATGTPLAWLVDAWSWRAGFGALALLSTLAWGAIFWRLHEPELPHEKRTTKQIDKPPRMSIGAALASYGVLLRQPFTWGILALSAVGYAAFITLRGLWLGPLLVTRNDLSLVGTGNVVLVLSVISIFSAPIYGRIDPGEPHKRRRWICRSALASAALLCLMALVHSLVLEIACAMALGMLSGNAVLQYADVRRAYPHDQTGRAMAVFTMAMFMGVALMQWATGALASLALAAGFEPYKVVLLAMALMLAAGVAAFVRLPAPPDEAGIARS